MVELLEPVLVKLPVEAIRNDCCEQLPMGSTRPFPNMVGQDQDGELSASVVDGLEKANHFLGRGLETPQARGNAFRIGFRHLTRKFEKGKVSDKRTKDLASLGECLQVQFRY